jgi:4-hydroxy-L-threonine phosphate dehydrogenase PdxA
MTSTSKRPLLGITMGDPGGIGPEVCVKALADFKVFDICRPMIVGDAGIMANAVSLCRLNLDVHACQRIMEGRFFPERIDVLDLKNMPMAELRHKTVTPVQGKASFEYIDRVIALAMSRDIDGTVTGPINKAAINAAGFHYAGHTEIYADKTGTSDYAMMLTDRGFRVTHVSTHVSLREACDRVKKARILKVIELTNRTLLGMEIEIHALPWPG